MANTLHCSKCGKKTRELYSPDWVCADCVPKEIVKLYPGWNPKTEKKES